MFGELAFLTRLDTLSSLFGFLQAFPKSIVPVEVLGSKAELTFVPIDYEELQRFTPTWFPLSIVPVEIPTPADDERGGSDVAALSQDVEKLNGKHFLGFAFWFTF